VQKSQLNTLNLQHRLASGAAAALDRAFAIGVVVVGQLVAALNGLRRSDPDRVADDLRIAVRLARMIDEARDVAPDIGVDDPAAIQLEAPDTAILQVSPFSLETLGIGDLLAGVMNNPFVLRDDLGSEDAATVEA
jgi:hypothetical protein